MDKVEKILNLYVFILYIIFVTLTILAFIAGPLILGLIFSLYWLLGYIVTAVMAPLLITIATSIPSIYRLLMED